MTEVTYFQNIDQCYESKIYHDFKIQTVLQLHQVFRKLFLNKTTIHAACQAKEALDSCINDPAARECLVVQQLLNQTQANEVEATTTITHYIQLDYLCNSKGVYDSKLISFKIQGADLESVLSVNFRFGLL